MWGLLFSRLLHQHWKDLGDSTVAHISKMWTLVRIGWRFDVLLLMLLFYGRLLLVLEFFSLFCVSVFGVEYSYFFLYAYVSSSLWFFFTHIPCKVSPIPPKAHRLQHIRTRRYITRKTQVRWTTKNTNRNRPLECHILLYATHNIPRNTTFYLFME